MLIAGEEGADRMKKVGTGGARTPLLEHVLMSQVSCPARIHLIPLVPFSSLHFKWKETKLWLAFTLTLDR